MSSREAFAQQGDEIRSRPQYGTYSGAGPSVGSSATHAIPGVRRLTTEVAFGAVWFIGWLFEIGYAKLLWWQAIIAIVLWPYYLNVTLIPI
jgi:hypothetical protein